MHRRCLGQSQFRWPAAAAAAALTAAASREHSAESAMADWLKEEGDRRQWTPHANSV